MFQNRVLIILAVGNDPFGSELHLINAAVGDFEIKQLLAEEGTKVTPMPALTNPITI